MYSETITKLINQFERLPGIGHKTAVRLAFYILEAPKSANFNTTFTVSYELTISE